MMKTRLKDKISRLIAPCAAIIAAGSALAADNYWPRNTTSGDWGTIWSAADTTGDYYIAPWNNVTATFSAASSISTSLNIGEDDPDNEWQTQFAASDATFGLTIGNELHIGTGGAGKLSLGAGTWQANSWTLIGTGAAGDFTLTDGTFTQNGGVFVVGQKSGAGTATISGGVLNLQSGFNDRSYIDADTSLYIGEGSGGTMTISGGTVNITGKSLVGIKSKGILNLTSGTLTATGEMRIGGTVGRDNTENTADGEVNVSGGTFIANGGLTIGRGGSEGKGTLNVSGTGLVRVPGAFYFGAGSPGEINLDGGVLEVNRRNGWTASTINFNGGTLKALESSTEFMPAEISITVGANGGTLDTNGKAVTIASAITGTGTLTITGGGVATFTTAPTCGLKIENGVAVLPKNSKTGAIEIGTHGALAFDLTGWTISNGKQYTLASNVSSLTIPTDENPADSIFTLGPDFTSTISYENNTIYATATSDATGNTRAITTHTSTDGWIDNKDYFSGEAPNAAYVGGYTSTRRDIVVFPMSGTLNIWASNPFPGNFTIVVRGVNVTIEAENDTTKTLVVENLVSNGSVSFSNISVTINNVVTSGGTVTLTSGSTLTYPKGSTFATTPTADTIVETGSVTWQGEAGADWNTDSNWDTGAVPTSTDDVEIPSGSTITLSAAAYAATITADETVTITVSGNDSFTYAEGLKSAFQNTVWKGTFQICNFNNTNKDNGGSRYIGDYSNSGSTLEFSNCTFYRIANKVLGYFKVTGTVKAINTYGYSSSYNLSTDHLTGSGTLQLTGTAGGWRQNVIIGDATDFTGSLVTAGNNVGIASSQGSDGVIKLAANYTAGLGLGSYWQPSVGINIAGTVKVQEGAGASATEATLKAPTVTFEDGAAIQFAKLGTIAVVGANDEAITPSGSGIVTVSIADGITPEAATTTLISWKAAPENLDFELASGSSSKFSLEKTAVGLVLKYEMPEAQIFVNGAASTEYPTAAEGIAEAIEAGADNYDYLVVRANVAYETTTEKLANLKFKLATGVVVTITTSDTNMYEYEVAGTTGDDGVTTYAIANTGCEYTWIGAVEGLNWSNTGNWQYNDNGTMKTASRKLTSDDTATIPANKTVNLTEKSYAASIVADKTVVIASNGFGNAEGLKTALKNSNWKGTYRVTSYTLNSGALQLPDYGNSESTIEFGGTCSIYRFQNNSNSGSFSGTIKVTGTLTEPQGFPTGSGSGGDGYKTTTIGALTGTGSWIIAIKDSNYAHWYNIGDASEFAGSLSLVSGIGSFYSGGSKVNYGIAVGSGKTFGLGLGATWSATLSEGSIAVSGTLKVQEGADATAATATLKAPTVTFNDGAAIQFAKLGTIAIQDAEGSPAVPVGSGMVTVSFGDGVVLTDGAILMTWASAPENLTFVFADSTLDTNWDLVANASGLTLKATGIAPNATSPAYATEAAATAALSQYSVVLTDAQEKQGLDASYYTTETYQDQDDDKWYVRAVLKNEVAPEVAEGVTVKDTTVTIPATKLKKGLYYRVVASADAAGTGTKTTGAWSSEPYSGSGSLSLTAELPESGVLYYAIEASDTAQ